MLALLAGTFDPLTLDELNEAMMIEVGESRLNRDLRVNVPMDIVVACGSLVAYDEETRIVSLSHYSVKEYLIGHCPNYVLKSISDMHAHIFLLLATYFSCYRVDEMCRGSDSHPLLEYALKGSTHLGHVSDEDPCLMAALSRLCSQLCEDPSDAFMDLSYYQTSEDIWWLSAFKPSVLFIPIEFGQPWMVKFLVKQRPSRLGKAVAYEMGSPLFLAMSRNPDLLSVLVELGVDLNKPWYIYPKAFFEYYIPSGFYTPISWATAIGSEVAVAFCCHNQSKLRPSSKNLRMLGQHGADVNFIVDGSTPIHTLLSGGWRSDEWLQTVKALVQPSCDLSVQDWTARTALHIALDEHLEDIIPHLLRKNAQLSGTATLQPDMWSWAQDKKWFANVQAAALAADQPCTRI
ncbi:hypothetical protein DFH29DRAFT_1084611 [Suillus ampliporus]|nr:hypothetical protein DFH29DRAFT_1084611 [Suillus ampliporus]